MDLGNKEMGLPLRGVEGGETDWEVIYERIKKKGKSDFC